MNWLKAFFTSSVGRKYVMAFTGLFLCFFLVVHLGGNLLLYVGEGVYNEYAKKLHASPELLIPAEILLYVSLALHIGLAIGLQVSNQAARKQGYSLAESKRGDRIVLSGWTPDQTMLLTGMIVLVFIIVHVSDFKFEIGWRAALEESEPFAKARVIVSTASRGLIYLIGSVVLGYHVSHGLQSAFQSLGWNHSKYTMGIRYASWIFGFVVAVGFGSFPVVAWIRDWGAIAG
ncbi:succinate dehydrogenase cytochrome b subunit [Planctomicrobium sp. SH664]|uniref:succinate dehydrogenase cytochrome b subunit n=1 Tax=Planctomicrobium sp. SH664 TaxID=3448125 RepID=UPI003F5B14E4